MRFSGKYCILLSKYLSKTWYEEITFVFALIFSLISIYFINVYALFRVRFITISIPQMVNKASYPLVRPWTTHTPFNGNTTCHRAATHLNLMFFLTYFKDSKLCFAQFCQTATTCCLQREMDSHKAGTLGNRKNDLCHPSSCLFTRWWDQYFIGEAGGNLDVLTRCEATVNAYGKRVTQAN